MLVTDTSVIFKSHFSELQRYLWIAIKPSCHSQLNECCAVLYLQTSIKCKEIFNKRQSMLSQFFIEISSLAPMWDSRHISTSQCSILKWAYLFFSEFNNCFLSGEIEEVFLSLLPNHPFKVQELTGKSFAHKHSSSRLFWSQTWDLKKAGVIQNSHDLPYSFNISIRHNHCHCHYYSDLYPIFGKHSLHNHLLYILKSSIV